MAQEKAGWLVLMPDEDGNPCSFIFDEAELAQVSTDYGVTRWLDALPEEKDVSYWSEGTAILLRFEVVPPPED